MNVLKTFQSQVFFNGTKYYIAIRGPKLWNNIINKEEKHPILFSFKRKLNQS